MVKQYNGVSNVTIHTKATLMTKAEAVVDKKTKEVKPAPILRLYVVLKSVCVVILVIDVFSAYAWCT